jgi:SCY1-like protein 2
LFYLYFFLIISSTVLNVEQFQRFMAVIKKLGDRVEKEHDQFLRDSQRIEDRSATAINGSTNGLTTRGGMDFETLVGGAGTDGIKADTELNGNWEDDVWGSILSSNSEVRIPPQSRKKKKR